jgi:hypothetical protein
MLNEIIEFTDKCGQKPGHKNLALYLGLFFEEVAETLQTLGYEHTSKRLEMISNDFLTNKTAVAGIDFEALLDDLFDSAWTAEASIHMLADAKGAMDHGSKNNLSKFDPLTGKPIKDKNGKLMKQPDWEPPQFEQFLRDEFK